MSSKQGLSADDLWHTLSGTAVLQALGGDKDHGLSEDEATRRLVHYGINALDESGGPGVVELLWRQLADFLIVLLILAMAVSLLIGEWMDAAAIAAILIINAMIGFTQSYRAEKTMAALSKLSASKATVVRDGKVFSIVTDNLVPGDIVLLEAGAGVPADVRLLETAGLLIEEAALTGESVAVEKQAQTGLVAQAMLAERICMAFKGTSVVSGRGKGIVVATGMRTELGRIAELIYHHPDEQTPLQKRLRRLGTQLSIGVIVIAAIIFFLGWRQGDLPMTQLLLVAVSLAVAAIPEALPAVVTVALALGARHMARKNALVRHLYAVETLGSVSVICTDKTGTLTENSMRAEKAWCGGDPVDLPVKSVDGSLWQSLFRAMALNNDVRIGADGEFYGDPTEIALLQAAQQADFHKADLEVHLARFAEIPFDSARKTMSTLHRCDQGFWMISKGAPEIIALGLRDAQQIARMLDMADHWARDGYRVLAFAERRDENPKLPEHLEVLEAGQDLIGLVALMDPPRADAPESVIACKNAGITPIMITGDHPATAAAIATRLAILEQGDEMMTGSELQEINQEQLCARLARVRVFARVNPEHKIRIVEALQSMKHVVAMIGDGVNDAPALKRADVGVAMGRMGTDVARDASDLILLDDRFATIVSAVKEGRRIYENIRQFIRFILGGNSAEILTMLVGPFMGMPLPLLPIHILWVNLMSDGIPGIAITANPAEKEVLEQKPRPLSEGVLSGSMPWRIAWLGVLIASLTLLAAGFGFSRTEEQGRTMALVTLTFCQLAVAVGVSIVKHAQSMSEVFANRALWLAVTLTALLQLVVVYTPWGSHVLHISPLSALELFYAAGAGAVVLAAMLVEKRLVDYGVKRSIRPVLEPGD